MLSPNWRGTGPGIRRAIHLIDVLHVDVVDQVEGFHAGCSLEALAQ